MNSHASAAADAIQDSAFLCLYPTIVDSSRKLITYSFNISTPRSSTQSLSQNEPTEYPNSSRENSYLFGKFYKKEVQNNTLTLKRPRELSRMEWTIKLQLMNPSLQSRQYLTLIAPGKLLDFFIYRDSQIPRWIRTQSTLKYQPLTWTWPLLVVKWIKRR